jgi:transcriptional regulator with XRE-family HTH domain
MLDAIVVGNVIQELREKKGLSQEVVSGLAGIGRTHLSAVERGERKPTMETFFRISDALQIKPSELMAMIEAELAKNEGEKP